jgi:hypothetical protein
MVSFHEDPEQYKSVEMVERIDSSIQRFVHHQLLLLCNLRFMKFHLRARPVLPFLAPFTLLYL